MPLDKAGKFHLGIQRAHAADRSAGKSTMTMPMAGAGTEGGEKESVASTTLHDHGDGTFHTEGHDGEREEHPHIGHAMMHMAAKHSMGGTHMHMHHDGEKITTHHVGEDGQVEGPHEHGGVEEAKEHMASVMGGEGYGEGEAYHGEGGDDGSEA